MKTLTGAFAPHALPRMSRAFNPPSSKKGSASLARCSKAAVPSSADSGNATQVWMPKRDDGFFRVSAPVRSEWVMPSPAIIQLTSPGWISWSEPETVAVLELAAEEVGDRGEPDMGMRAHVDTLPGQELDRAPSRRRR